MKTAHSLARAVALAGLAGLFGLALATSACSSPMKAPTVQGPPPEYVPPAAAAAASAPALVDKTPGPPPLPLTFAPPKPTADADGGADSGRP